MFIWMLGDDLLSHGETPHYHRRVCVSLLSSGWDQVVPQGYCHQANSVYYRVHLWLRLIIIRKADFFESLTLSSVDILSKAFSKTHLGCMVKPLESLVHVSSTPHNAYTPCLSTS